MGGEEGDRLLGALDAAPSGAVAAFLEPLLAAASAEGAGGAAPLALAKRYAPFLVALLGKALPALGPKAASPAAEHATAAVAGLRAARAALKGRPLEVELQTAAAARKLTASGHAAAGADLARRLYLAVALAHGEHGGRSESIFRRAMEAAAAADPPSEADWPPPPAPGKDCSAQAAGLLVTGPLQALVSAAAGALPAASLLQLLRLLPLLEPWLSLMEAAEAGKYRDSLLRYATKAAVRLSPELPPPDVAPFIRSVIMIVSSGGGSGQIDELLQLAEALLLTCEEHGGWEEAAACMQEMAVLAAAPQCIGIYQACAGLHSCAPGNRRPLAAVANGTTGRKPRGKAAAAAAAATPPDGWTEALGCAVAWVRQRATAPGSVTQLLEAFRALNRLRKLMGAPEEVVSRLAGCDLLHAVPLLSEAVAAMCTVVEAGALQEAAAKLPAEQCALACGHAWSCAVAGAVLGARLAAALVGHRPATPGPPAPLCCEALWRHLRAGAAPALALAPTLKELAWLSASMNNVAVALNGEDDMRPWAIAPLEVSFQCSVATASASEGADAGQAAAEAAKRGALLARVMQRVGQPEGAAACLAAALARWASEGWDGMPLARALARLWLQGGQAETTGSDGQGLGVWAREVVGEGSWVTVARWLAWALLEESGVVAAQVLQQLEPIVGELTSPSSSLGATEEAELVVHTHLLSHSTAAPPRDGDGPASRRALRRCVDRLCREGSPCMASLLECVLVTGELLEGAAAAAMSAQWAAAAEALKRLVEADLDSRRGSESVADLLPRRQLGVAVLLELGHLASVHGHCMLRKKCLEVAARMAVAQRRSGCSLGQLAAAMAWKPASGGVVQLSRGVRAEGGLGAAAVLPPELRPDMKAECRKAVGDTVELAASCLVSGGAASQRAELHQAEELRHLAGSVRPGGDHGMPGRTALYARALLLLSAAEAASRAGSLQAALADGQEALAIAALLHKPRTATHRGGEQHDTAEGDSVAQPEEADAAASMGGDVAGEPDQRGRCALDDLLLGVGPACAAELHLSSLLAVARLYDALGCVDEATAIIGSGLRQAQALHACAAEAAFLGAKAAVLRRRREWGSCTDVLAEMGARLEEAPLEAGGVLGCGVCQAVLRAEQCRVEGDLRRRRGCHAEALRLYADVETLAGVAAEAEGLCCQDGAQEQAALAQLGAAKCHMAVGDSGAARELLEAGLGELGLHADGSDAMWPLRQAAPPHALLAARWLWLLAQLEWRTASPGNSDDGGRRPRLLCAPSITGQEAAPAARSRGNRSAGSSAGRKRGGSKKAAESDSAPSTGSAAVLPAMIRAYDLAREQPLLRRAVTAALAAWAVGPSASLLFAHASMGATVQQQYALAASARLAAARRSGKLDTVESLEAVLGEVLARLEAPALDIEALAHGGEQSTSRKGGGRGASKAGSAAAGADALVARLEEQADEAVRRLGDALLSAGAFPVTALLPFRRPGGSGESLLLSRWTPGVDAAPLLVELPLPAPIDDCFGPVVGGTVRKLEALLEQSSDGVRGGASVDTAAGRKQWWQARMKLDQSLRDLLHRVESEWLGTLSFLLLGEAEGLEPRELEREASELSEWLRAMPTEVGPGTLLHESRRATAVQELVRTLLAVSPGLPLDTLPGCCAAVAELAGTSPLSADHLEHFSSAVASVRPSGPASSTADSNITTAASTQKAGRGGARRESKQDADTTAAPTTRRAGGRISRMAAMSTAPEETVGEQEAAADGSLLAEDDDQRGGTSRRSTTRTAASSRRGGRGSASVARGRGRRSGSATAAKVTASDETTGEDGESTSADAGQSPPDGAAATALRPVLLVLDSTLQALPWESLEPLRSGAIYRTPSLACAAALGAAQSGRDASAGLVDIASTFYLLNPSQDLAPTQTQFEAMFLAQHGWEGCVGRAPPVPALASELQQKDLFIYFGHGGAEKYLPQSALRKLNSCAAALLMGCSSGRLRDCGDYESTGVVLAYLTAGCPAAIANLWDVTDRDIDRFSQSLLDCWTRQADDGSAAELVGTIASSRGACRLPFLTGAAPVCFGIPSKVIGGGPV
eukprot:jgi/Tetstr1/438174/TSEL_026775.t2